MKKLIGERLKKIRIENKKSQPEMAEILKVSFRSYCYYENGERDFPSDKIPILMKKFNINIEWFFTGEGDYQNTLHKNTINDNLIETKKTTTEVPAIPGISADEHEAIRIIRENPELKKALNLYSKIKNLDSTIPKLTIQVCPELV